MDIKAILKKVEDAPVPQVKKVALAYSGGLDSTLGIEMLRRKYKAKEIVAITIDVGQGDAILMEAGDADILVDGGPSGGGPGGMAEAVQAKV